MKRIEATMIELAAQTVGLTMEEVLVNVCTDPAIPSSWVQHLPMVILGSWGELDEQTRIALFLVGVTAEHRRKANAPTLDTKHPTCRDIAQGLGADEPFAEWKARQDAVAPQRTNKERFDAHDKAIAEIKRTVTAVSDRVTELERPDEGIASMLRKCHERLDALERPLNFGRGNPAEAPPAKCRIPAKPEVVHQAVNAFTPLCGADEKRREACI